MYDVVCANLGNRAIKRRTRAHLASTSASYRGAAASLHHQSERVHGAFRCKAKAPERAWSPYLNASGRDEARTLSPPPPRTVEQPQACSICLSCMAASVAKPNHLQCTWSQQPSARSRHEHAPWSRPPPRTVEQPQACSISLSCMSASVAKPKHLQGAVASRGKPTCRCASGGKHSPPPEC